MSNNSLGSVYARHHSLNREKGFSILKEDRGSLLRDFIGTGKQVLDIGCRDGALTQYFSKGNEVLGVDIDEEKLNEAHEKLGIQTKLVDLNGDWSELGDKKFDAIVAGEVLEHLYYPDVVVSKVAERLSPGGIFVGSVPNAFSIKNRIRYLLGRKKHTPLSDPTHINHFHNNELETILKEHFSSVEIIGLGRYPRLAKNFPGEFGFDLFFICKQ